MLSLLFVSLSVQASDFCQGYADGYYEGYCYDLGDECRPEPVACPYPSAEEDDYSGGFRRGLTDGLVEAGIDLDVPTRFAIPYAPRE